MNTIQEVNKGFTIIYILNHMVNPENIKPQLLAINLFSFKNSKFYSIFFLKFKLNF